MWFQKSKLYNHEHSEECHCPTLPQLSSSISLSSLPNVFSVFLFVENKQINVYSFIPLQFYIKMQYTLILIYTFFSLSNFKNLSLSVLRNCQQLGSPGAGAERKVQLSEFLLEINTCGEKESTSRAGKGQKWNYRIVQPPMSIWSVRIVHE